MTKQLDPSLALPSAMQSVKCSGVKHTATIVSGVRNHASLSGNPMDESGFCSYLRNAVPDELKLL